MLRLARRKQREAKTDPAARRSNPPSTDGAQCAPRPICFPGETVTQEDLAEHVKRIRNDYCKGTLRDTLNRYVPRPAGPRTAIIRCPKPIAIHEFEGSVEEALTLLRGRMQEALDGINSALAVSGRLTTYANRFHGDF